MTRKISPLQAGVFIMVTSGLALGIIFWIGLSHLFEQKKTYVSYFAESVKGLQKDAIINYRGVPVGRVGKVDIAPDGRLIEVVLNISKEFVVDDTLVIRLREQGITGLRFLEIDKGPPDAPSMTPKIEFTPPYPLIPSYPSEMQAVKEALERLYYKIIAIDFQSIANAWVNTAEKFQAVILNPNVENTITAVAKSSKNLEAISLELKKSVEKEPPEKVLKQASTFLKEATKATTLLQERIEQIDWNALNNSIIAINKNVETLHRVMANLEENLNSTLLETQHVLRSLEETLNGIKQEPGRLLIRPTTKDPFKK